MRQVPTKTMLRLCCAATLLAMVACGAEDESGQSGGGGETDIGTPDTGGIGPLPDISQPDVLEPPDGTDKPDGEAPDADVTSPQVPTVQDFGDPCNQNADCIEGWCVPSPAGNACTQTCIENCPDGWSCQAVSNVGQDVTFICVNLAANLCRPCLGDSECKSLGVDNSFCLPQGDAGSFCGSPCTNDSDCPKEYGCESVTLPNGVTVGQCVPQSGQCACNGKAISESAATSCTSSNEFGSCQGARVCLNTGLTPCSPVPKAEACNGQDDNCDGIIDNVDPIPCQVDNQFGTCEGLATCQNGVLLCDAVAASPEICDGIDNNCDGTIDVGATCDDGNVCTTDACVAGVGCVHTAINCSDGDACTTDTCNPLTGCQHTPTACNDGNACTVDGCDPAFGCKFTSINCDDGDACNGKETCDPASGCKPGQAPVCTDGNVCTVNACDPLIGCTTQPLACDDGNSCTQNNCNPATGCVHPPLLCNDGNICTDDACLPGVGCAFTQVNCNDNNACTADFCDPAIGCVNQPINCDDGDQCTSATCDPATGCKLTFVNCSDGDACNGIETCDSALGCLPGTPLNCEDGLVCTEDSCDPLFGCVNFALDCDDGEPCTIDSCDDQGGCVHLPLNCDDGNVCNGQETCQAGVGCVAGSPLDCDDGDVCTNDFCNPASGCVYSPINCTDNNACTTDSCSPTTGCTFTPIVCDDGNICTGLGTCDPATGCLPGTPLECDDGNACTADSCDPATGCASTPINCNDGDVCTEDSCDPATGCVFTPVVCEDGNACTTGSCETGTGCVFFAVNCDDGDACNGVETCAPASGCQPGTPLECDDGNPCTGDSCNPASGCTFTSIGGPCDDGNACTTGDECLAGMCVGVPVTCPPDGDPCTVDACSPDTGACYAPIEDGAACDDQEQCTTPDLCVGGFCEGTPVLECQDPSAQLVCIITGQAGQTAECPIQIVNADPSGSPPATAIQLTIHFDSSRAHITTFQDGQFCPVPPNCLGPYLIPEMFNSLQSGHLVEVNPKPMAAWNGAGGQGFGEFLIVHLSSPDTPLSSGTMQGGAINGDPTFITARFDIVQDIPADEPVLVTVGGVSVADPDAAPLDFEILDLLIRTQAK